MFTNLPHYYLFYTLFSAFLEVLNRPTFMVACVNKLHTLPKHVAEMKVGLFYRLI